MIKRVIYQEQQKQFFQDVLLNRVVPKMQETAEAFNLHPGKSEIVSWQNNAPKIKDLLELSGVSDTYVTFEYLVPYNMKRIDCMIYGVGNDNTGNVVHIELKQWGNESVKTVNVSGNFEVDEDITDTTFKVEAYTGGNYRIVSHPSQQVRGYSDYLTGFVEVLSTRELGLQGYAYCYNYTHEKDEKLYDPIYAPLLKQYRTYSGNEVEQLAEELSKALRNGQGFSIFNKMMSSPIRPSKKLLESAADMVHAGNESAFSLIEDQIVARNVILDKIRRYVKDPKRKKAVIIVKGGPGTGKTVIALHILALVAKMKSKITVHYATKSKPLLEGIKNRLPRGSQAKLLFSNVTQFIPANFDPNSLDVLLVDEAHRISQSANNQYTPAEKRTSMPQIETLIRAANVGVFFIDDKQAIRSVEIGSTALIRETAKKYNAEIEEVELTSQFRCNGSDNYLDWLEDVLYNRAIEHHFSKDDFDFQIMDSPTELYKRIVSVDSEEGKSARLTAGFCWPWSSNLDDDGELVKDVRIGDFAMPWETKDTIKNVPAGYVKWFEWAYKPEGVKQVGCIYTAQGFEFDVIGVIVGPDLYVNQIGKLAVNRNAIADPVLRRSGEGIDDYVRNIYRVLMSRGMKGCYVYFCNKDVEKHFRNALNG
jgi:hypothetical protein